MPSYGKLLADLPGEQLNCASSLRTSADRAVYDFEKLAATGMRAALANIVVFFIEWAQAEAAGPEKLAIFVC